MQRSRETGMGEAPYLHLNLSAPAPKLVMNKRLGNEIPCWSSFLSPKRGGNPGVTGRALPSSTLRCTDVRWGWREHSSLLGNMLEVNAKKSLSFQEMVLSGAGFPVWEWLFIYMGIKRVVFLPHLSARSPAQGSGSTRQLEQPKVQLLHSVWKGKKIQ